MISGIISFLYVENVAISFHETKSKESKITNTTRRQFSEITSDLPGFEKKSSFKNSDY